MDISLSGSNSQTDIAILTEKDDQKCHAYVGYKMSPSPDSHKQHLSNMGRASEYSLLDSQKESRTIPLLDRVCVAQEPSAGIQLTFDASEAELKINEPSIQATSHQHEVSGPPTQPHRQQTITSKSQQLEKFNELNIQEQVKLLTHHKEVLAGDLLDKCTPQQREALSKHNQFPTCCWPALNIRLIEDNLIDKQAGKMFRENNHSKQIDEAAESFAETRTPDEILTSTTKCASLLCRIQRNYNLLRRTPLANFEAARFSTHDKFVMQNKLAQVLRDAMNLMSHLERDLFTVIMRCMKNAYQTAPLEYDYINKRISRRDLLRQFSENTFGDKTLSPKIANTFTSSINRVNEELFYAKSVLLVLLDLQNT